MMRALRMITELNAFQRAMLVITMCLAIGLIGCERPLRVTVDGKNPPTFKFDGTGEISWVYIYQVTPDGKVPAKDSEFWILVPRALMKTREAPPITYGVVPNGFNQRVPAQGAPLPLEEGKVYGFGAETRNAPGSDIWFMIRDGKSVQVPKTDKADPE